MINSHLILGARNRFTERGRRTSCRMLLVLLCLIFSGPSPAQTIGVLVPKLEGAYQEFVEALKTESQRPPAYKLHVMEAASATGDLVSWPADTMLVATVGVQASRRYLLQNTASAPPAVAALIPRAAYDPLVESLPPNRPRNTALFLDQSFGRQLDLMRILLPGARRVGVVLGPQSARDTETFRNQAASRGLQLNIETAARESQLYSALQGVMQNSDVLLLIPDPEIINAATAQNVLLTALRRRMPIFAFSAAYVRAGALAAVYSSARQQGFEVAQMARTVQRGGGLPAPRYPRYFGVAVNRTFAEQLGIDTPGEAALVQRLGGGDISP